MRMKWRHCDCWARRGEQEGESKTGRGRGGWRTARLRRGFVSRIKRVPFISKHENSDRDQFGKRERTRTRVLLQGRLVVNRISRISRIHTLFIPAQHLSYLRNTLGATLYADIHRHHEYPATRLRAREDTLPDVRHVHGDVHGTRGSLPGPPDDAAARGPRPSRYGDHEGPHHVHLTPVYVHQIPPMSYLCSLDWALELRGARLLGVRPE